MINIQIHEVVAVSWAKREEESDPRVLEVHTKSGIQRVTLFSARPEKSVEKQPEPDPVKPKKRVA